MAEGGNLIVAEAGNCDVLRHPQTTALALHQRAEGREIRDAEHGLGVGPAFQHADNRLATLFDGDRRHAEGDEPAGRKAELLDGSDKAFAPLAAARVARGRATDVTEFMVAFPGQRPDKKPHRLFVGESDHLIDGFRRQLPGFDYRDARVFKKPAGALRMGAAGQNDAFRPPTEHRFDQLFFLFDCIVGVAEQKLQPCTFKLVGNAASGVGEVGIVDRRDDSGDEPRLARGQAAGRLVEHVAEVVDRDHDLFPRRLGNPAALFQGA